MRYRSIVLVLLALTVARTPAGSESLGSAARRERERRQKNEEAGIKPVRTITHEDVRTKTDDPGSTSAKRTGSAAKAGEDGESSSAKPLVPDPQKAEARRAEEEGRWRSRAEAARRALQDARELLQKTPPTVGEFNGERWQTQPNWKYAEAQQRVERAEKAIRDLEEEARRAGVPPGWLR